MDNGGDITVLLRPYLQEHHAISEEALRRLLADWNQQGSFVDFLVGKQLLPRSTARTLEAVRKGYLSASLESVLGLPEKAAAAAPAGVAEPAVSPPPPAAAAPLRPADSVKVLPATATFPGVRVGRYVLQEQLGKGIDATVFRAFDETLNLPVTIKFFSPFAGFDGPAALALFREEAQTLGHLEHPHVVRILDAETAGPFTYLVMEYVGDTTLAMQVRNLGKLPASRIAQIGGAVAEALEAAGKVGLLHRNVKPSNILERRDGHIKLVDFTMIAKLRLEAVADNPQAADEGSLGAPLYIAPEHVLRPAHIDFRADMYSLGATLYHCAVGCPPLVRDSAEALRQAHLHDEPVPIWERDPSFDVNLGTAIHRMLRKDPDERFSSWAEVRAALTCAPVVDSAVTPGRTAAAKPLPDTLEFAEPASAAESKSADALRNGRPPLPQPPSGVSLTQIILLGVPLLLFLLAYTWFGIFSTTR